MSRSRRILLLLLVLGAMGNVGGTGTFASFNASTSNPGATFATGTLVLSNQKDTAGACLSTGADNIIGTGDDTDNAKACDTLFSLSLRKPGDSATVDLTLQNVGTLDASALKLNWADGTTACTTTNAAGTYRGTGDLCTEIELTIQQYTDGTRATPQTCWYGGGNATTCAFDGTKDLADFDQYDGVAAAPDFLAMGALAAGATRHLRISLQLPNAGTQNSLQGRQVSFGFNWTLDQ